jgi:hypothetical protein
LKYWEDSINYLLYDTSTRPIGFGTVANRGVLLMKEEKNYQSSVAPSQNGSKAYE